MDDGNTPATAVKKLIGDLSGLRQQINNRAAVQFASAVVMHLPRILQERSLMAADEEMIGRNYSVEFYDGPALEIPGELFGSIREQLLRDVYFGDEGIPFGPGDWVLDLGATHGVFSTIAATRGATVIAVEGQQRFLSSLEEQISRNGCLESVRIVNAIIGGDEGVVSEVREGDSPFDGVSNQGIQDILDEADYGGGDIYIKMDIEGSEFSVLREPTSWLDQVKWITIEVHPSHGDHVSLLDFLKNESFQVAIYDELKNEIPRSELSGRTRAFFARGIRQ